MCYPHRQGSMRYQVTLRHGGSRLRYHTFRVDAPDAASALRYAAEEIPPEIRTEVDLVELRAAPERPEDGA